MKKTTLRKLIADYAIEYKENYYRLAFSYVRNVDDALDIVQESIYKALSSMDTLKNPIYIKTWLYKIVVNTSLDFLRKQKKTDVVDVEFLSRFDSRSLDNYQDIDLQKALDALPVDYRNVITLRFFEDLMIEEVAEVLNENVNTVKTRLYRTLKMLRIQMNDEFKEVLK